MRCVKGGKGMLPDAISSLGTRYSLSLELWQMPGVVERQRKQKQ